MDWSTPGFPVCHNVPELAQTHFHWVDDAIQPFHPLSSLQSGPASESLPMIPFFSSSGQSIGPSASKSVLPVNRLVIFRAGWFDLHAVRGTLQSKTPVRKHQFFHTQPSLRSNSHIRTELLPSPSLLCSPHNRPVNLRDKVLRQGRDFKWGVSQPRRWQASASK